MTCARASQTAAQTPPSCATWSHLRPRVRGPAVEARASAGAMSYAFPSLTAARTLRICARFHHRLMVPASMSAAASRGSAGVTELANHSRTAAQIRPMCACHLLHLLHPHRQPARVPAAGPQPCAGVTRRASPSPTAAQTTLTSAPLGTPAARARAEEPPPRAAGAMSYVSPSRTAARTRLPCAMAHLLPTAQPKALGMPPATAMLTCSTWFSQST